MSRNILVQDAPESNEAEPLAADAEHDAAEESTAPESTTAQAADEQELPEKYRGKSIQEIIEMHQNAEKKIGQQANEVGTYRELLASLAEAKRASDLDDTDTSEPTVEVTTEDLLDRPAETLTQVIDRVLEKRLKPLSEKQEASELTSEIERLRQEHPDMEEIGADPSFNEWVSKSEYRLADAQKWIESKDVQAARRLLSDFKEFRSLQTPAEEKPAEKKPDNVKAAREASTESGRSNSSSARGAKTLSKAEVMRVFMNDRDRYDSPAFQKMLAEHARKGTLV